VKLNKYLFIILLGIIIAEAMIILKVCLSEDTIDSQKDYIEYNESLNIDYNYTLKGNSPDEFEYLFSQNPIDAKSKELYDSYDGSTRMITEIEEKIKSWWQKEMEVAYNQLLILLNEEDKQNLIESQTSWVKYMENKKQLDNSFFLKDTYNSVGELRKSFVISNKAKEIKARAYSLLEYQYIINGEINMIFSSKE